MDEEEAGSAEKKSLPRRSTSSRRSNGQGAVPLDGKGRSNHARKPEVGPYMATAYDLAVNDLCAAAFYYRPDVPSMVGSGPLLQYIFEFAQQSRGPLTWAWSAMCVCLASLWPKHCFVQVIEGDPGYATMVSLCCGGEGCVSMPE